MASYIVGPNSKLWWGQYDIGTDTSEASFAINGNVEEATPWGSSAKVVRSGMYGIDFSANGFQQHDSTGPAIDDIVSAGGTNIITACGHDVQAEGDVAYVAQLIRGAYEPFAGSAFGTAGFAVAGQASGNWFRGRVMAPKASRASTSNTTGVQLGTIAATKMMHASLHVFSVSGSSPTLDVLIESDDNSGFSSAVTRMTFTQATAIGSEFLGPTAGPGGTDDYWRVSWTIGGTSTPTFGFAVVFGDGTIYG